MECKESPRAVGKKKSCSTAGKMRPWGLHAHKFNCTARAFCRGIIEGVDGPNPALQSSFGKRVEERLHSLGFAADDCSGDKEDIIRHNNHQLRQDKAKLIGNIGSLEADCIELEVGCCLGSQKCEAMGGRKCALMVGLVQCQMSLSCGGWGCKAPAKSCFNAYQKFTAEPIRKASGRTQLDAVLWPRVHAMVHACAAILVHPTVPENGLQNESQMPQAPSLVPSNCFSLCCVEINDHHWK